MAEESLPDLIASISDELQTFEYQWHPDLSALTVPPGVPLDATALRFAFGERLFNTYAQYVGGVHVLQSKRLALAEHLYLGAAGRDVLANPDVLARLAADVNERRPAGEPLAVTDVLPSFAGYLLEQKPASPRELFDQAVQLRAEKAVARHRTNLFTLRASVGTGSFSAEAVSDLAASAAGVTDWLREQWAGVTPVQRTNFLAIHGPTVAADLATTGGVVTSVMAAAGVAALSAKFILGDAREQRSYAKLLGDARREQQRWDEENKLLALWGGRSS